MDINATILGQTISFIIFVVLCMKYLWPPIIAVIEKRQKEISDMFNSIEQEKKISKIERMEASNCLKKSKDEAELIITNANQYKNQLINQAKHEAYSERTKILLQTYKEIDIKKKCVFEELQKEIGSMVILGIEKILEHPINNSVNNDIINAIINELSCCNIKNIDYKKEL